MKFFDAETLSANSTSPSMRREWIEMKLTAEKHKHLVSLPPCGGSGLKCFCKVCFQLCNAVSLHAEGVD